MSRSAILGIALAAGALAACGESPTTPGSNLVGLWNLPHQEQPTIYGLTSAQVIFRADSSFQFIGTNPLSMSPVGEFVVTGTWTRHENTVTLSTGDEARLWNLNFNDEGVRFTDPLTGETFQLFRPLPD